MDPLPVSAPTVMPEVLPKKSTHDLLRESMLLLMEVYHAGGEVSTAVDEQIDAWLEESADKLGALRAVKVRAENESELLKAEIQRLQARRAAFDKVADRMNEKALSLLQSRQQLGQEPKVKTNDYTVWLQTSHRVVGPDLVEDWPPELVRVKMEPDKERAKELIAAGTKFDNVSIQDVPGVRWR